MNEIYKKLADGKPALEFDGNAPVCQVYELWVHKDSNASKAEFPELNPASIPDWLQNGTASAADPLHTLALRLVLVGIQTTENTSKTTLNISNEVHGQIVKAFGLELALEHLKSTVTSVTAFPKIKTESGSDLYCYSFNHAPKLAAVWSQVRSINADVGQECAAIQGIIYVWEDAGVNDSASQTPSNPGSSPNQLLRSVLDWPFCADLYSSGMAPALLLAIQLGFEIDLAQSRIKAVVSGIEEATTHCHIFEKRVPASAHAELGQLAIQASGSATKLASIDRKSASMKKVLHFIIKELDKEKSAAGPAMRKAQHLLRHHVGVLDERREMQMLDTNYVKKRVDIQINALFNMMIQQDNSNGIELAQSSHDIARASYRHSASMKMLAIVTVVFLPGSFVSAMFSMPMFKWDETGPNSSTLRVSPQFGLYWAITLSLTCGTFLLCSLWLWYGRNRRVGSIPLKSVDSSDGGKRSIAMKKTPNDAVGQRSNESSILEARNLV